MKSQSFDFDEWAELARTDPVAFEARRQAVLAIELARAPSLAIAEAARASLRALDEQAAGKPPAQRMALAAKAMADSVASLTVQMDELAQLSKPLARS